MYELDRIEIGIPDKSPDVEGLQWAEVEITLARSDSETGHRVRVPVCIQSGDSQSIAALKQQALDQTATILEAVLRLVTENDVASLYRIEVERRRAREAAHEAEMKRSFDESMSKLGQS